MWPRHLATEIIADAKALSLATGLPCRAINIDTTAAALGASQEDNDGLGRLRILGERIHTETGATVFWSHHEGKGDHNGPRGHLILADACGCWWWIEEKDDGSRVVHVTKANRGKDKVPLFAFRLEPFEAGRDVRDKPIMLCELRMTDLDGAVEAKARERYGAAEHKPPVGGAVQRMLMEALHKLTKRHPEGVEEDLLQSEFVPKLHQSYVTKGKPEDATRYRQRFLQTLESLVAAGRIARADTGRLLPCDR